mmetsp:Transcript_2467/g.5283  ORF Transcript_2467/g.5283 Transcript_2467/m.5283 type:complete len:90 (+) Transcript_2467:157-426(+)
MIHEISTRSRDTLLATCTMHYLYSSVHTSSAPIDTRYDVHSYQTTPPGQLISMKSSAALSSSSPSVHINLLRAAYAAPNAVPMRAPIIE